MLEETEQYWNSLMLDYGNIILEPSQILTQIDSLQSHNLLPLYNPLHNNNNIYIYTYHQPKKFKDLSIRWFDWDHFTCTISHPDFRIARVDPKRLNFPRDNHTNETTTNFQMTIGQGWLSKPCVLPGKGKNDMK